MRERIIFAEDEEQIRRLFVKHIVESDRGYTVIGEASNGQEALELIRREMPDILVTDICMPVMDGLELIRQARELSEELQIIVISGYDDFAYARGAMSMGVREYLLKPFLPKDLFEALDKSREIIRQRDHLKTNMEQMSRELEMSQGYSREYAVSKLLEGGTPEEIETYASVLDISQKDLFLCVSVIRFGGQKSGQGLPDETLRNYMEIIKNHYFPEEIRVFVTPAIPNQLSLIAVTEELSPGAFFKELRNVMEKIALSMWQYHKIRMQCTVGKVYSGCGGASQSYREAMDTWRGFLNSEDTVILWRDDRFGGRDLSREQIDGFEEQILIAVQMGDGQKAVEGVSDLLDFYGDYFTSNMEYVSVALVKLVLKISDVTEKAGGEIQAWKDQEVITYLKRHFTYGSLMEAKDVLTDYVKRCCALFREINATQSERIIQNAKMIIEKNISNSEFGLEPLADEMHFSSNYIRQLFKANTGQSFSDYLIEKRMTLAGKLMRNPSLHVQEISEMTGYSDQRYFARCFKKHYGCTPTEYRKKA